MQAILTFSPFITFLPLDSFPVAVKRINATREIPKPDRTIKNEGEPRAKTKLRTEVMQRARGCLFISVAPRVKTPRAPGACDRVSGISFPSCTKDFPRYNFAARIDRCPASSLYHRGSAWMCNTQRTESCAAPSWQDYVIAARPVFPAGTINMRLTADNSVSNERELRAQALRLSQVAMYFCCRCIS